MKKLSFGGRAQTSPSFRQAGYGATGVTRLSRQAERVDTAATTASARSALAHPAWWAALAVLVLNDHVLKGGGLLPAEVTGKLSDIAGLVVAPVLLAAVLAVRSARARALCCAAVAVPFAAIKLSATAASVLTAAVAWVGLRYRIWVDPGDLVALAVLPIAFRLTRPAVPAAARWPGALRAGGMVAGVLACGASSYASPSSWTASAYVVNTGMAGMDLRIRFFEGELDCDALDDGLVARALPQTAFADGITFAVARGEVLPISRRGVAMASGSFPLEEEEEARACEVVLLQADGMRDIIVWWRNIDHRDVPVTLGDARLRNAGMEVGRVDLLSFPGNVSVRKYQRVGVVEARSAVPASTCARGAPLAWGEIDVSLLGPELTLLAVAALPDGCFDLELERSDASSGGGGAGGTGDAGGAGGAGGGGQEPAPQPSRLLLCGPAGVLPFTAGDAFILERPVVSSGEALRLRGELGELTLYRGITALPLAAGTAGDLRAQECEGDRTGCGAYVRAAALSLADGDTLAAGEEGEATDPQGRTLRLFLGRSEQVLVSREGCEAGRDALGLAADLATVWSANDEGGAR
ncbi:MAG: hypothetical protein WKG00_07500 [Polyangiaceae bacterium]